MASETFLLFIKTWWSPLFFLWILGSHSPLKTILKEYPFNNVGFLLCITSVFYFVCFCGVVAIIKSVILIWKPQKSINISLSYGCTEGTTHMYTRWEYSGIWKHNDGSSHQQSGQFRYSESNILSDWLRERFVLPQHSLCRWRWQQEVVYIYTHDVNDRISFTWIQTVVNTHKHVCT